MAVTFFPFDSGSGANVQQAQWTQMAQLWFTSAVVRGVGSELQVYADSTGLHVKAHDGEAWIQGAFASEDGSSVITIAAADATNPRIDRVCLRVDWTNHQVAYAVVQGTPGVSPTPSALTQTSTVWDLELAQVRVNATVVTIAATDVTDCRRLMSVQDDTVALLLTNQTGGWVYPGDVVILDTGHNRSFVSTTTPDSPEGAYVVIEAIGPAASGLVALAGVRDVQVTGTTARGDYLATSGTAKQAKPSAYPGGGDFARAIDARTGAGLVRCLLLGVPHSQPQQPSCQASGSVAHAGDSVAVTIALTSEAWDTAAMHDNVTNNTRITAPVAGKYLVTATATWSVGTGGTFRSIALAPSVGVGPSDVRAPSTAQGLTTVVALAAGDYVSATCNSDRTGPDTCAITLTMEKL